MEGLGLARGFMFSGREKARMRRCRRREWHRRLLLGHSGMAESSLEETGGVGGASRPRLCRRRPRNRVT